MEPLELNPYTFIIQCRLLNGKPIIILSPANIRPINTIHHSIKQI